MARNLKTLGLCLVAVLAIGMVGAQGALAVDHEFSADGQKTVVTGEAENHEITVGTKGTIKCKVVTGESTSVGIQVDDTWETDQITATPHYSECEFGGTAATVSMEHCAVVLESDTTSGNPTGGEHANVTLECEAGNSIKVLTSACTLTIGAQVINHAVRYENDTESSSAINVTVTAHEINFGNLNDKAGCVLFPKGKIGKYKGTMTAECFRDDGETLEGTAKTTPTLVEGPTTECSVTGA